ncbi:MAG: sigma-54-dependent Fis family transcriptional regulator [Gemmataceae bacterium]|nr:sigma-54-dependent Fis family transcriptional regulator [Gemmataceae bacterium]
MPNQPKVLIIDDEPGVCYSFRRVVAKQQFQVVIASTVAEGVATFRAVRPSVVVLDLNLPDGSGMDAFRAIRETDSRCPVLFITAHGTTETALEAMKDGAFDYLVKPVDLDRLSALLERALDAAQLMQAPSLFPTAEGNDRIVGRSPQMQEMCKVIGLLAPQNVNVLIRGESGTGKELVARALYQYSRRSDRPFLAINCAALPEQLLESELFGHEQGAFTGATRRRIGKFEQCHSGTLFRDEIGDMSLTVQAKMLRILQDQRFERLGGTETIQADVRLLAATNQELERLVAEGRFRADLYYRLKVATVQVPALRDRREDISELAHYFLFTNNRKLGVSLRGFSPEALVCLQSYAWPGNVRELQSVVKEAMVRTRGHLILPEYLPEAVRGPEPATSNGKAKQGLEGLIESLRREGETDLYARVIMAVERVLLADVLGQTNGNQLRASEILGIDRKTLRQKLRNLGLTANHVLTEARGDGPTHLERAGGPGQGW